MASLHFARDDDHLQSILRGAWRTVKPGDLFFSRLASKIGGENLIKHLSGRRYLMADGTERCLVDEP
jgi:tellurite methyltransferase